MTTEQERLASVAYGAIITQIKTLGFGEMAMLKAFYLAGSSFKTLPDQLKQRLLAIAMVIRGE